LSVGAAPAGTPVPVGAAPGGGDVIIRPPTPGSLSSNSERSYVRHGLCVEERAGRRPVEHRCICPFLLRRRWGAAPPPHSRSACIPGHAFGYKIGAGWILMLAPAFFFVALSFCMRVPTMLSSSAHKTWLAALAILQARTAPRRLAKGRQLRRARRPLARPCPT